ncbi:MAG: Maf family protein [Planctomycetota bacterium]
MASQVVLASSSRYRQELLARILPEFCCCSPQVDEESVKNSGQSPQAVATELAGRKAAWVAERFRGYVVIGSDQLVDLDGRIFGKPETAERARAQLAMFSGRPHRLLTAVCVLAPGRTVEFLHETRLWMRNATMAEISACVERDQPLDCAGSYRIEGASISLFERIECSDQTAIIGLPLLRLSAVLREFGVRC